MIKITEENGTKYKSLQFMIGSVTWSVMEVSGQYNYVNVRKVSHNPFGGLGKDYPTWADALAAYKSQAMKEALMEAQKQLNWVVLTKENAPKVSTIINIAHPEWGYKKFNYNSESLGAGNGFASTWGVGCNSAVLFEDEFKFWAVNSFK